MTQSTGALLFQHRSQHGNAIAAQGRKFADVFTDWQPDRESFLFFAPHDDDSAISLGMVIREARREGIPVRIVVVTEGQNGYVSLQDKPTIVARRAEETYASYELLGVARSDIVFLSFPDGGLQNYYGRQVAKPGEPSDDYGFTGLENHFVRELRRRTMINGTPIAPTRIFVPSAADYHQDHVAVAREIPISIFHAIGGIWPECGEKIDRPPCLYWHCVYCPFADGQEPNIRVVGNAEALATKIKSVEAYNSQGQIAPILDKLRTSSPVEYLLEERFSLFQPGVYDHCFSS